MLKPLSHCCQSHKWNAHFSLDILSTTVPFHWKEGQKIPMPINFDMTLHGLGDRYSNNIGISVVPRRITSPLHENGFGDTRVAWLLGQKVPTLHLEWTLFTHWQTVVTHCWLENQLNDPCCICQRNKANSLWFKQPANKCYPYQLKTWLFSEGFSIYWLLEIIIMLHITATIGVTFCIVSMQ